MPSPLDSLRNDIEEQLATSVLSEFVIDPATVTPIIDVVMQVLAAASGEQRRALLETMGYEVERCLVCPRCGEPYRAPHAGPMPMEYDPAAYTSSEKSCPCCTRPPFGEPGLVLRDLRETTDPKEAL